MSVRIQIFRNTEETPVDMLAICDACADLVIKIATEQETVVVEAALEGEAVGRINALGYATSANDDPLVADF